VTSSRIVWRFKAARAAGSSCSPCRRRPDGRVLALLRMHRDSAINAAPEIEPENMEEIRDRLFNKLERLRQREERRRSSGE
jgi:hypothetical protein